MHDDTYTLGDMLRDQTYMICYAYPGRYAAVPVIRAAAALANVARRLRCHRLARRLAWYAYDVADHTPTGREFRLLKTLMPWAYPVADDWQFRP
jgi:hypothetical protein